jgi:hypothetical protein
LDNNGTYQYIGEKNAKLFFIFPVKVMVKAQLDPETGQVIKLSAGNWWSFLAKDDSGDRVVGASCGTVSPGSNSACCQNKGYDLWDNVSQQCEFSQ